MKPLIYMLIMLASATVYADGNPIPVNEKAAVYRAANIDKLTEQNCHIAEYYRDINDDAQPEALLTHSCSSDDGTRVRQSVLLRRTADGWHTILRHDNAVAWLPQRGAAHYPDVQLEKAGNYCVSIAQFNGTQYTVSLENQHVCPLPPLPPM